MERKRAAGSPGNPPPAGVRRDGRRMRESISKTSGDRCPAAPHRARGEVVKVVIGEPERHRSSTRFRPHLHQ